MEKRTDGVREPFGDAPTVPFGPSFRDSEDLRSRLCGRVPDVLLGLVHINMGSMSRPDRMVAAVREAEAAGFDSVWAGEHVVLPDPSEAVQHGCWRTRRCRELTTARP